MMARLRYRSMYATSFACGYAAAALLWLCGQRWTVPAGTLIRTQARSHAEAAEHMDGPYLAPITLVAILIAGTVGGALLIAWLT